MLRFGAAVAATRDLETVTRELNQLRFLGSDDAVTRWKRTALEEEQLRARNREKERNLTDHEAARQSEHLQQLVNTASAEIHQRISNQKTLFVEALGEAFAKERRKIRDELKRNVDEQVTKLRTGPQGQRGMKGDKGEYGARTGGQDRSAGQARRHDQ
jgi:hypothetical protein